MRSSCKAAVYQSKPEVYPIIKQSLYCHLHSRKQVSQGMKFLLCCPHPRCQHKKKPSPNTDTGNTTMEAALLPTLLCSQASGAPVTFSSSLHGSQQAAALPQETAMRRVRRLATMQPLKEDFCWHPELPQRLQPLLGLLLQLGSETSKGGPPWGGLPVTWSCSSLKYREVAFPFSCPLSPPGFVSGEVQVVATTPPDQIGHFPPQPYIASNFWNIPQEYWGG